LHFHFAPKNTFKTRCKQLELSRKRGEAQTRLTASLPRHPAKTQTYDELAKAAINMAAS